MPRNAPGDRQTAMPGVEIAAHPRMGLVHLLRSVAVDLDLQAAAFATENRLHPTDVRALIAMLDRLEALGLLARERDPHDRRRVLLIVSEEAKTLGWSFFGPLIARILAAMDEFDETDLDAYERVLRAVAQALPAAK